MEHSTYNLDVICLKNDLDRKKIIKHFTKTNKGCDDGKIVMNVLKRLDILSKNKDIVKRLLDLPLVEQKSDKWYLMRQNLITASDFAQALGQGKFGSQADIIKKKVRPDNESAASFNNPFFKWGNMFEPVANEIYSKMHYNVRIHEFGLIPHPTLSYFGASPDGITDTGIMIEIKCPYKRKIQRGDEVPKQYYYQIQGQLEVCGLKECDYFECQFHSFGTLDEFYKAYGDQRIKGVIVERCDGYKYSPIVMGCNDSDNNNVTLDDLKTWIDDNTNEEFIDVKFWYLHEYNLQRVTLDKVFVDEKLKDLKDVWDKILYYRENSNKYDIEVLKIIDIGDTPKLKKVTKSDICKKNSEVKRQMTGYSFIVDPGE